MKIDAVTKRWIRNASDELAAANGCRFDEARGQHVIDFATKRLRFCEGDCAGRPFIPLDWQADLTYRLFGWVRYDEEWARKIRRFRKASIWISKKAGKTPTLAWWGLYTFCADGEQGQKVFSSAKDGQQASLAHGHAVAMVESSPYLSKHCVISRGTMRITHPATRSVYRILSGDNVNGQEGINGSIMVDETHVVDQRLANVISRAGISRSEPLHIEVSTAGNNPQSYGKKQWDRGLCVEAGTLVDERLFFAAFAAPQDLTDDQLAADPLKYALMANPSLGHTVKRSDFLDDYNASKDSLSDLQLLKMYRLNIWAQSDSPWLRSDDWEKCRREFVEDAMVGKRCVASLDLSKTRDMSALVLIFEDDEDDETFWQLAYFWMPEGEAKRKNHLAAYLQWAADGFLELTPGNVVDYRFIKRRVIELHEKFDISGLAFDKTYAEEMTQALEDEQGIERFEFPQNMATFAGPTAAYERLVMSGKLLHNGNPVLSWQAGNASVKTDEYGNKRPVKQRRGDFRKVDGIVAGVMALPLAMNGDSGGSVYDDRGPVWLQT